MLHRLAQALGVDGIDLFKADTPRDLAMLRTRLGLMQADVAQLLQAVGRAYYSGVEQGTRTLQDEGDQRCLAELLQVDVAEVRSLACGGAAAALRARRWTQAG
jgi:transcriptional regulator with XRE-family HTH domain